METEEKRVYDVRCINCGSEMARIVPMGLAMEGGNVQCPKCKESYSYRIYENHLVLKRHSIPAGFSGEVERAFAPIIVKVARTSPTRPSSMDEAYEQVKQRVRELPEGERLKVWATVGREFRDWGFSSSEILSYFEHSGARVLEHCLIILSTLHYTSVAESDLYWAWYMVGRDLAEIGESDLARAALLKALSYPHGPNAAAPLVIRELPQVESKELAEYPFTAEDLLTLLQEPVEEREKRKKQWKEEIAQRTAAEERRVAVQEKRKSQGQCIMCGTPLGFFDRLFKREKHSGCTRFVE
jgi:phage FluMu protein Com